MKTKSRFLRPLFIALCGGIALVQSLAAVTWDGGGGAVTNWNEPLNWGGTAPGATGSDLIFDTSNNLININNIVTSANSITYNAGAGAFVSTFAAPVTTLTLTGSITDNSTATQTLNMPITLATTGQTFSVVSGGKLVFGATGVPNAFTFNCASTTFSGEGEIQFLGTGNFQVSTGTASTVNMSGLTKFTGDVGAFRIANFTNTTNVNSTVRLAATSTIIATTLSVGASSQNFSTEPTDTLRLGTTNTVQADNIVVGQKRNDGVLNFDTGLTNPSVTITGKAGGAAKAAVLLGDYNTSNTTRTPTGNANFTGGTVNATLSTLIAGQINGTPGSGAPTAEGFWTMPGGTVTADTVRLGYYLSGAENTGLTAIARGTLTLSGGDFTVGTALRIGSRAAAATVGTSQAIGTVTVSGGTLNVSGLLQIGDNTGGGVASDQRGTLTITGGVVNVNVDITTLNAQSTLTLDGGTLDMKGYKIGTAAQPIGGNGGALSLLSGTLQNVSDINGGAALVKTGTGTLTLAGTNSYPGLTTVSAGTLKCATLTSLYSDLLANATTANTIVASGATLGFNVGGDSDFAAADITTVLTNLAASKAVDGGFKAGSNIGFDTAAATGGTFTFANVIADSTGTGAGSLGVTKLGANTLVLTNSNTYTGTTTVMAGTLALGNTGAVANSATVDIRSGATLDVSGAPGWTLGSGQTLKGTGTLSGDASAAGTVSPGASIGTLAVNGNLTFAGGSSLAIQVGTAQVETANPTAKTATADGNVLVTVTGAGIAGSPLVVTVPILNGDTGVAWAAKVRAALAASPAITALYAVGGSPSTRDISLTRIVPAANDATLNIAVANGTPSPGITATPTSANTTAGSATGSDVLAVTGNLNVAGCTLNLTAPAGLAGPTVVATYGTRSGTLGTVNGLPAGATIDYAYNASTAIAIIDAAAPAWVGGWPKADTITTSGFTARVKTDETSNAWFVVLPAGATAPSTAQVKAGQDGTGAAALKTGTLTLTANIEGSSPVTGLSASTAYDVWFVAEDTYATPNVQGTPTKVTVVIGPPLWASGYPKADSATATTFTARAATNEAATAYFVVLANDAAAPSSAQVKAGQDSTGAAAIKNGTITLTANTENTAPVSGLTAATDYDVWFVAEDALSLQAAPVKVDLATLTDGGTTYTVTYLGNGSTGGSAPVDGSSPYPSGATVTVSGNTGALTKTGYAFTGWNTAAGGGGTAYSPGNTFVIAGDTVLYAQWTVTYGSWVDSFFPGVTDQAIIGSNADPDHDGVSNGIEFMTGTNPNDPTSHNPPVIVRNEDGNLVVTFQRVDVAEAYPVSVESSTNLQAPWTAILVPNGETAGPPVTVVENGASPDSITVVVPGAPAPVKFARVKIVLP